MVAEFSLLNNSIFAGINTGGPNNYGPYAKILKIELDKHNKIKYKNILVNKEEIPPSGMILFNNLIYGVYPGYTGASKPRWLRSPEDYTKKLKLIDPITGKIIDSIELPYNHPQKIVQSKDNLGFINYFTNIDMSGEYITVVDLHNKKIINKIKTSTPSFMAIDKKHLYVTNYNEDSLSIYDLKNYDLVKQIKIGKWPKKILLINK